MGPVVAVRPALPRGRALLGKVLGIFARAVFGSLRRRARDYGITRGQCGAVTFIQRFGSALNLTPHFHMLVFEGSMRQRTVKTRGSTACVFRTPVT